MKKPGDDVLLHLPSDLDERVLHRALIIEWRDDGATLSTSAVELPIEEGNELLVYYTAHNAFVQQPILINSAEIEGKQLVIDYTTQGDPISAENRENFRVTTITAQIKVLINGEDSCIACDLSETGFAALSQQTYKLGEVVTVTLERDDESYSGSACVQAVRSEQLLRSRYGFRLLPTSDPKDTLDRGLNELTQNVQREQLRRIY